jgi:hypothetical protein
VIYGGISASEEENSGSIVKILFFIIYILFTVDTLSLSGVWDVDKFDGFGNFKFTWIRQLVKSLSIIYIVIL